MDHVRADRGPDGPGTSAQARRQRRASPAARDLMQRSEHARLLAGIETMPVIEQAGPARV